MNDESTGRKGGFQISASGGSTVNFSPNGEFVGGDKISSVTTTNTVTIEKGFAGEDQKQQFQLQVDQLRETLRALKASIDAHSAFGADEKEAMVGEIIQHIGALKEVKEKAAAAPAGKAAPVEIAATVERTLDRAGGIVDKLKSVAENAAAVAETVGKFAVKYGPLVASARHLFGLP
jgi:hypothetical protein